MPITLLLNAVRRARRHALGLKVYVNPFTKVSFADWSPHVTRLTRWIVPAKGTDHFTAFEEAMNLYHAIQASDLMDFDLVDLQPCLADFTLTLANLTRRYYIQEKIDARMRAVNTPLTKVDIARAGKYFFDARDRYVPYYIFSH